jgi:medium-chain acyl-[acyl-carrier-protein] hydrolase
MYDMAEADLVERLRQMNGTPREILDNPEMLRIVLPMIRADFQVLDTYRYQPDKPFDFPISAFGGSQDTFVPVGALQSWKAHTCNEFSLHMFPGDHFFLTARRKDLLRTLRERLTNTAISEGCIFAEEDTRSK